MNKPRCAGAAGAAALLLTACASTCPSVACGAGTGDGSAHKAHDAYVEAINSNQLEPVMGMMTEDIVFMPPNGPRLVGKDAVRSWAAGYLEAYDIHWDKTVLEFVVSGGWAFEQYAYQENDTPRIDGVPPLRDTGKGIIVYRLGDDGVWRVARDVWNSDLPAN